MANLYRDLEFYNHNSVRSYPLAESADGKDVSDTFALPDNFIVGLRLPINWRRSVQAHKFFLSKLTKRAAGYALTFSYQSDIGPVDVANVNVPASTGLRYQQYQLTGLGDFEDTRGVIVIGTLVDIENQPAGTFEFDLAGGRLEPDTIIPDIRHVPGIKVSGPSGLSEIYSGVIRMAGGRNMRITPEVIAEGVVRLTFDAIEGEGLTEECVCYDSGEPIKTITGIPPVNGNIDILGNTCFTISTGQASLTFNDECSQPCCGPTELQKVTQQLSSFGSLFATLESRMTRIETRGDTLETTVLGARLADRGCRPDCS